MESAFQKNNPFGWFLLLMLGALIAFKFEALFLPYFWDEAWVYMPAIRTLAEKGPSVMPGCIDAELYTGHPLLFYFLAASWIKFWGYSLWVAHLFPLLISLSLLVSIFYITFQFTKSHFAAILATLLLLVQPIFLTQSTYLLIEIWLGFLFVWAFYFYYQRQWFRFAVILVMALWSKESAYTLVPAFILIAVLEISFKQIRWSDFKWRILAILALFVLGFSFFVLQRIEMGWFFFPRHANWINFDEMNYKFHLAIDILFKHQGRAAIYLASLGLFVVAFFVSKYRLTKEQNLLLGGIAIFSFGYMLFASINFFSTRYLFGAIPLLMMACAILINGFKQQLYIYSVLGITLVYGLVNINNSIENPQFSDVELSYTRLLKAEVEMTQHLDSLSTEKRLYAPFLMLINLSNPYSGMVKQGRPNLSANLRDSSNFYFLALPNEYEPLLDTLKVEQKLILNYRAKYKQAEVDLYQVPE
jgi:hypothetical protein